MHILSQLKELKEKYPREKHYLDDLYYDVVDQSEKVHKDFLKYMIPSAAFLFLYTSIKGPLPILRREGRLLGTHRVFRQYAYTTAIIGYMVYAPFYRSLRNTSLRLSKVNEYKEIEEDGFVAPEKPMHYPLKMTSK